MKKLGLRLPYLLLFGILALYSCVLVPLYQYLITDVVLSGSLWLDLVDLLYQHLETLGSIATMTLLVFGIYRYRLRDCGQLLLTVAAALLFKYVAAIIAVSIEFGSIDLTGGLSDFLFAFLLELAIAAFTVFLANRFITPVQDTFEAQKSASKTLALPFDDTDPVFPFQKLFSWKNPAQRTILLSIITVTLWRLIAAIVSEFTYGVTLRPGDIPVILLYWFILILLPAFYSYFLALLFFRFCDKESRRAA